MIRRPPTQISLQSSDVEELKMQRQKIAEEDDQSRNLSKWTDQSGQQQQQQHLQKSQEINRDGYSLDQTDDAAQGQR